MRPDVVATFPPNYFTGLSGHTFTKRTRQAFGNAGVFCFLGQQVGFESITKDGLHAEVPKTC